jgi:tetratricopeptide (TPR) repeat protein
LQAELQLLRQELLEEEQRRRGLPREPIVGLRFLDVGEAFKDRGAEMAQLRQFVTNPAVKLVVVVGRGGMGKTALVSKLCAEVERGELRLSPAAAPMGADGIIYVSYRGAEKPGVERLFHAVGRVLGSPRAEEVMACWLDPTRALADKIRFLLSQLRHGCFLLVLDNLEDILSADHAIADGELKALVDLCLTTPHGLRLLVTSREHLQVAGPGMKAARTLALDGGLPAAEAAALLRESDPHGELGLRDAPYALLDQAVRRCHGVPRALETVAGILASRYPTLTLEQLLGNDALFTEQVVENLVSEHYRQVAEGQRRVLEALAVFDKPVPAAAAGYLLQPFFPDLDVRECLHVLVRNYFVTYHRGQGTFELHPLDREYAYSRIPDQGDGFGKRTLHRLAADFYAELRKPESEWQTITDLQPQLEEFEQLCKAAEYDRAFLLIERMDFAYLAVWGYSELVISLRGRLSGLLRHARLENQNWYMLGLAHNRLWLAEGAIRCFQTLVGNLLGPRSGEARGEALPASEPPGAAPARTGVSGSVFDLPVRMIQEKLGPFSERDVLGDVKGNLGRSLMLVGRTEEALRYFEETILMARHTGNLSGEGLWTGRLGEAFQRLGQLEAARRCHQFALEVSQALGDKRWQVTHLSNLGETLRHLGDLEKAEESLRAGLELAAATGNRQGQAYCLMRLAQFLHQAGQWEPARDHYERGLRIGLPPCNMVCAVQLGVLLLETGQGEEAQTVLARGMALCRRLLDRTPRLVDALYLLALAQLAGGQAVEALAGYRRALEVCPAPGVIRGALDGMRPLGGVRPPLPGLDEARRLLEQGVQS